MRLASLATVLQGTRAIKRVPLPLQNSAGPDGNQTTVEVGLRCLLGDEQADIYRRANEYAGRKGGKAEEGDPLWSLALSVYQLAVSAVDPDSDPSKPKPFFGAGDDASIEDRAVDILSNPLIGRDTIVYLAEQQELFQDEVSPHAKRCSADEFWHMIGEVVEGGARPLLKWGPALRLSFTLFLAGQLWNSRTDKSSPGSSSEGAK